MIYVSRNKLKSLLSVLVVLLTATSLTAKQDQDLYWYVNGEKQHWKVSENIVAFRSQKPLPVELKENLLEKISVHDQFLTLQFRMHSSPEERSEYLSSLRQHPDFGTPLLAINQISDKGLLSNKTMWMDDQLLVNFMEPIRNADEIEAFEEKYNLKLINKPSRPLQDQGSHIYIFRHNYDGFSGNSITVSAQIFEQEAGKVMAQPNRINMFEPHSTNDSHIEEAWHLANSGQQISCSNLYGTHHADAQITGVWNAGYTGQGIKVGVIDFYGFDYNHPDMQGQFLPGWDCIHNKSYNASNFYYTQQNNAHGMAVAGIVGAQGNNNEGTAGVAYGAKIIPFLIDGSESSVILALQKAMSEEFDVDVINCSFGSYFDSPAIKHEMENVTKYGRNRGGTAYGIVVVASHGNDHYNDMDYSQYPSAYEHVISVAASTPDDKKKTPGDTWDTAGPWGTNYGSRLHLAAPGVCIFTTDLSGSAGYSSSDYVGLQKTSAAAPIVSGVAALLLSKQPETTWQDVINALTENADKVNSTAHGGTYNYSFNTEKPGQSQEVGYGRVNAYKAIVDHTVSIPDWTTSDVNFHISTLVNDVLTVTYNPGTISVNIEMTVYDLGGRLVYSGVLPAGSGTAGIELGDIASGMYITRFVNGADRIISTARFIKVN